MILRGLCTALLLMLAVLVGTLGRATSYRHWREDASTDEEQAWREFQEFREWKRLRNNQERDGGKNEADSSSSVESGERQQRFFEKRIIIEGVDDSDGFAEPIHDRHLRQGALQDQLSKLVNPPPIDQPALMGRFIVNQADWTSVATISSRKDIASFPCANVISFSDGPLGNGTGIPYMYLTPLDFTAQDIAHDRRATLMMTLAQGAYCKQKIMDPMDPRCARILLTGIIKEVKPGSPELEVAKSAVFERHPWLANMPADHHFFFAKLKIASIAVLDTFGGPKYVTVQDYFHPPDPKDRHPYRRRYQLRPRDFSYETDNDYPQAKFAYQI